MTLFTYQCINLAETLIAIVAIACIVFRLNALVSFYLNWSLCEKYPNLYLLQLLFLYYLVQSFISAIFYLDQRKCYLKILGSLGPTSYH